MNKEIILKKTSDGFIGAIPHLGLISSATDPEKIYEELEAKRTLVENKWASAGLSHLLKNEDQVIRFHKLEKKFKRFLIFTLLAYFLGLIGLGIVISNSAKRVAASWSLAFKAPDSEREAKKLEKFRSTLKIYKPYIQEVKKAFDEKDDNGGN